jgi:glycosyltransferase involved in cell wall biosynthesis
MAHVREVAGCVDLFVAPSRTVRDKILNDFGISPERVVYLDYGFDTGRLAGRTRAPEHGFVFGYIGTHRPAKGIQTLLEAFPKVKGDVTLRIWGRSVADTTPSLKEQSQRLPEQAAGRVEWMGEYGTPTIVSDVFNRVDALVVPSIWLENSPLVIHEAQQARVPIITADLGGMAEYVHHGENGLLFKPRDPDALAAEMQRLADNPTLARRLGDRGYLYSADRNIPSVEEHVRELVLHYETAIRNRGYRAGVDRR